jgi:hypothetical protein
VEDPATTPTLVPEDGQQDPASTPDDAADNEDPTQTPDDGKQPEVDVPASSTPDPSSTPPTGLDDNGTDNNDDHSNDNNDRSDNGDDSPNHSSDDLSSPQSGADAPPASQTEPQPVGLISVANAALSPPTSIAPVANQLPNAGEGASARQQALIELLAMALAAAGLAGIATGMRRHQ